MPAHQSVLASSSVGDGELGHSDPVGKATEETLLGRSQWVWSSLYDQSSKVLDPKLASRFMETTEVLLRGGDPVAAAMSKSTKYSNKFTPSLTLIAAKYSQDTSPAHPTPLINRQEASFHMIAKSSLLSTIPLSSNHSSSHTTTHHMESVSSSTIMRTIQSIPTANLSALHEAETTIISPTWIPELGRSLKRGAAGKVLRIQSESQVSIRAMSLITPLPHQPNIAISIPIFVPTAMLETESTYGNPK